MNDDEKAAESAPLSPLLLYLSSSKSLRTISKDLNIDYPALVRQSKREQWESVREQYRQAVRKKAVERAIDVDFRQITDIKTAERTHITEAIDQLETLRRALHLGNQSPEPQEPEQNYPAGGQSSLFRGKKRPVDDYQLTIERLVKYSEARQTLQKMLYKSYGIEQDHNSQGKTAFIFNNYPQGADIVTRYSSAIETPPHGQSDTPTPPPNTTHNHITHINSEITPAELYDSVSGIEFTTPIGFADYPDGEEVSPYPEGPDAIVAIMTECTGYVAREEEGDGGDRVPEGLGVKKGVSFTAPEVRKKLYPRVEAKEEAPRYEPLVDFDD